MWDRIKRNPELIYKFIASMMPENHMFISLATPADLIALQTICRKTFEESYAWYNTVANMNHYLEHNFGLNRLEQEINHPNSRFYLLYKNSALVGYIKLNFGINRLGLADPNCMEIERIYVLQAFHGMGFGQELYARAVKDAGQNNIKTIWLGVWENNRKAMSFYTKNKFQAVGTHIFKFGDDDQTDFVMELNLIN